jgi:hypothetical protein
VRPTSNRRPTLIIAARVIALIIVTIMAAYFITTDAIRGNNPFLVPDMVLTAALLVSALLPQRSAAPALIFSFGWAAGDYTTSMFTHIIDGRFPVDHVLLILFCVGVPVLLARDLLRGRQAAGSMYPGRPTNMVGDGGPGQRLG